MISGSLALFMVHMFRKSNTKTCPSTEKPLFYWASKIRSLAMFSIWNPNSQKEKEIRWVMHCFCCVLIVNYSPKSEEQLLHMKKRAFLDDFNKGNPSFRQVGLWKQDSSCGHHIVHLDGEERVHIQGYMTAIILI